MVHLMNVHGLTGEIPGELFSNCSKVTNFDQTFDFCSRNNEYS